MVTQAQPEVVRTIRELVRSPDKVSFTSKAIWDTKAHGLTRADVCEAIGDWIDTGKQVQVLIATEDPDHVGEPTYVLKPIFRNGKFYVKVSITVDEKTGEALLIVSCHPSR